MRVNAQHPAFDVLMKITEHEKVQYVEKNPTPVDEQMDRRKRKRRNIGVKLNTGDAQDVPSLPDITDATRDQE